MEKFQPSYSAPNIQTNPLPVTTVSAASYEETAIAPGAIVSAFGTLLSTGIRAASGLPLPTSLEGTTVKVRDKGGAERLAPLFFVSPNQINYLIPLGTAVGAANVIVQSGDGTISNGSIEVKAVAPALFSANGDGQGVPAASVLRVKANGDRSNESLAQFDAATGRWKTRPIDLGPAGERIFLELYLTGISQGPDPGPGGNHNETIHLAFGGSDVMPLYAGAQGGFIGLDQINVEVPRELIGRGRVNISVVTESYESSNLAEIEIAALAGSAPPSVSSFGAASALAGQQIVINGSGFSVNPAENLVRVGGLEARVASSTANQLSVIVPFGAQSGLVTVRTPQGEGRSNNPLAVRTSVSGFIENTNRQPIVGAIVKLTGSSLSTATSTDGSFILPDVPAGAAVVEVDGTAIVTPPYPKIGLKLIVSANQDNQFSRPITLQQATGPSIQVGATSITTSASANQPQATIQTGNIVLDLPNGASVRFPDGSTTGSLTLTQVNSSRTPARLPPGHFSPAIIEITPFGAQINPGAKLSFPNSDGLPAGAQARLFRLDQTPGSATLGSFVDAGVATVSSDGQRIETAPNAITETSYYFASSSQVRVTIVGQITQNGLPLRQAIVQVRGQETFTDGNGNFILRNIKAKPGESLFISIEGSFLRPSGQIDRLFLPLPFPLGPVPENGGTFFLFIVLAF
jgi:uncharacterized protein (TIGR03437 family)